MTTSPEWEQVLGATRHPNSDLRAADIPVGSGVYAWFVGADCVYVGKATSLRSRLGKHRSDSLDLGLLVVPVLPSYAVTLIRGIIADPLVRVPLIHVPAHS